MMQAQKPENSMATKYHEKKLEDKGISFDLVLIMGILFVPLCMYFIVRGSVNPFVDSTTLALVLMISIFLAVVLLINLFTRIALVNVLVLVYFLFWHCRFLSLSLFPEYSLTLTRTVEVSNAVYNEYVAIVFISLVSAVAGIFAIFSITRRKTLAKSMLGNINDNLDLVVSRNLIKIYGYCIFAFGYMWVTTQFPAGTILGFFSFLFPANLVFLFVALVLQNKMIKSIHKYRFAGYAAAYVGLTILSGSRSILLELSLSLIFFLWIRKIEVRFKWRNVVPITLLIIVLVVGFAYGTYTRAFRAESGFETTSANTALVVERMSKLSGYAEAKPLIGLALSRAGYLDFSAELYANTRYGEVVTWSNMAKSVVNTAVPGDVFEDGTRVSYRIRDIYSPNGYGYQSDALGAVGENYLLFGYGFPIGIFGVAALFAFFYYAVSGSGIYGIFIKFTIANSVMAWWNSFGYDWLLMQMTRELFFGVLVITVIFYWRSILGLFVVRGAQALPCSK
jgi:hypothetical protein